MSGYHIVSIGSLNEAIAQPREIFWAGIVAGAYGFVLVHNHPSGDLTPNEADRRMTRRIQQGAEIVDIKLPDHMVIGASEASNAPFYSFRATGLL